ncbi:MAG: YciC family protein [Cyclobacteriaceae bacterium]
MQVRPRIKIYEERDFGEKFNATFSFLSREFKNFIPVLFKILGIPLLITMLLNGLNTAFQFENMSFAEPEAGPMVFVIYFLRILVYNMAIMAVAGYVKVYNNPTSPEEKVTAGAVWKAIRGKIVPGFFLTIIYSLIVGLGLLLLIIPGIYLAIALSLSHIVYVIEDEGIFSSMSKSVNLVNQKWFPSFGFMFVMGIICLALGFFLQLPSFILGIFIGVSAESGTSMDIPIWATMLLVAIPGMIAYAAYLLNFLGETILYGSLREMSESPGIMNAIDNFGKREEESPGENAVTF